MSIWIAQIGLDGLERNLFASEDWDCRCVPSMPDLHGTGCCEYFDDAGVWVHLGP